MGDHEDSGVRNVHTESTAHAIASPHKNAPRNRFRFATQWATRSPSTTNEDGAGVAALLLLLI
jgi:hypothetical protein